MFRQPLRRQIPDGAQRVLYNEFSVLQCTVQYKAVQEAGNGKTMHLLSWSPGSGTWVEEEEIKESVFDLDQVISTTWR